MLILRITIFCIALLASYFILSIYQKTRIQEQKVREQARKEEQINELILKIKEYEGEIYNSVFEYEAILNSGRYISKTEYPNWLEKWSYLKPIIDEYTGSELVLDNDSDINSLKSILRNGDVEIKQQNKRFIESELAKNKEFLDNIEDFPLTDNARAVLVPINGLVRYPMPFSEPR